MTTLNYAKTFYAKTRENDKGEGAQSVVLAVELAEPTSVKIYRKKVEGFTFGRDSQTFFDGIYADGAEIVFDGELTPINLFAEYEDRNVERGEVYAYWIKFNTNGARMVGPAPVKVRDGRVWWHRDKIERKMKEIADKYDFAEIVNVGSTVEGTSLDALIIGNREKMIGGVGVVHAGESGPEIMLTAVEQLLCERPELFERVGFAILPAVNADMREKLASGTPWYIRKNANGVDINRNFDGDWEKIERSYGISTADPRASTYRGPYPNSEPETRAVINFVQTFKPIITFSYHWLASMTCDSFLCGPSYDDTSERHRIFCELARPYSNAFRRAAGAEIWTGRMVHPLCSNGGFSEWGYHHGYYAIDLEAAYFGGSSDSFKISETDKTDFETLTECIRLHKAGIVATLENLAQI